MQRKEANMAAFRKEKTGDGASREDLLEVSAIFEDEKSKK